VFRRPHGDYAGRLIEEAGCKGMRVGDAEVSRLHANFIVNRGTAKASDVMELVSAIRSRVFEKSGIYLELEQIPLS
jgi:UDP-N-acetylmuramate dehydrogenase